MFWRWCYSKSVSKQRSIPATLIPKLCCRPLSSFRNFWRSAISSAFSYIVCYLRASAHCSSLFAASRDWMICTCALNCLLSATSIGGTAAGVNRTWRAARSQLERDGTRADCHRPDFRSSRGYLHEECGFDRWAPMLKYCLLASVDEIRRCPD